ncbi:MAG: NAD-dependent epimerase/dehydratase family protein, partial [Desulfatiglandales bacterium]
RSNELMAYSYHHLYGIPCIGLRYFTVYGPWGRPDMALFLFVDAMLKKRPIKVFNYGKMRRDFTYIDDVVQGTVAAIERPMGYEILNLGNSNSVNLMDFIRIIEEELGMEAEKEFLPLQPGDVVETKADISRSKDLLGFEPRVDLRTGIRRFLAWYRSYFKV